MIEALLQHATVARVLVLLLTVWLVRSTILSILKERRVQKLGGHPARQKAKLPFGIDLVLRLIRYNANNKDLLLWNNLFHNHGNPNNPFTVENDIGGQSVILTADPENIKAILATQFDDYGKGPRFNSEWHEFLGNSIFTTDGKQWSAARALIRPQFIKERVSDIDLFDRNVAVLIGKIPSGTCVDIKELFFRYTLDAITEFLLGASVDSLNNPQNEMTRAFADVQHTQSIIARVGPLNGFVPRGKFRAGLRVMEAYLEPYIQAALQLSADELASKTKSDQGYTFLHALAVYTRDRSLLRDQLMAMFLAGRDTTAVTMSWLFYELSKRPDIVQKLRDEIAATVGYTRAPTYADLKGMKFLQHCLNEILRVYPAVPFNVRVALKDTTLPRGGGKDGMGPVGVVEGTPVGYSTHALHLLSAEYPPAPFPDPLIFEPSRWENWYPKAWQYIPFNGGPRLCVGQQFALTEMAYTVTRIFQRFSRLESRMTDLHSLSPKDMCLQREEGGVSMPMQSQIVLAPDKPVLVALYE